MEEVTWSIGYWEGDCFHIDDSTDYQTKRDALAALKQQMEEHRRHIAMERFEAKYIYGIGM